jgi:LemA protein
MAGLLTILVLVAGAVVLVPLLLAYNGYNRIMALDGRCETAFADIDVHLKHRHNLIPGLVETVRGFAKHESKAIERVSSARAAALKAASPEMRLEAEQQLGQSINAVLNIAESYPDLKASSHFRELSLQLADAENRVTASRRFYNLAVEEYNIAIRQFPGSRIAHYRRLSARRPYDLGIERVILDEPVAIRF